jgi:hypothetical protein
MCAVHEVGAPPQAGKVVPKSSRVFLDPSVRRKMLDFYKNMLHEHMAAQLGSHMSSSRRAAGDFHRGLMNTKPAHMSEEVLQLVLDRVDALRQRNAISLVCKKWHQVEVGISLAGLFLKLRFNIEQVLETACSAGSI